MENKIYTVAILGVGSRGADAYGKIINDRKDKFDIVSLCDIRQERLDRFGKIFGVAEENRFLDEAEFFKAKRADILVIATLDNDHVRQCLKAFELGYDVLLEKPITADKAECAALLAAQKKYGCKTIVCHVLRYAPAFVKAGELLEAGAIGRLVAIDALERVMYWHQAHSYVRGNWRKAADTTPMILAKCCHDLDLLQYYANSKCKSISSVGDLTFFNKENAPDGAAKRCVDCKYVDDCAYSAKYVYIGRWKKAGCPEDRWPWNVLTPAPVTEEKLQKAIEEGPYGRCVFACDNDVVDHQITTMTFENGVKASLTMTAFTGGAGRRINFHGTQGEIILDEETDTLVVKSYLGETTQTIALSDLIDEGGFGHGGGDEKLVNALADMIAGNASEKTSLEASLESHLMGICAEESRLSGGKLVYLR